MENLSHIAEDELSSIIQALSSHPEWVSEIRTQCDKLKHYPFPQLPKSWERLVESLIAADNNGPEPLQRGSYDIDNTVSRFKPGTEINDDIVNAYICLLRFATNTLRQKLMSTRFFSSLRNIHAREVDEEVTASTFRTLEKIIIPIYSNNHFTFAVIRNKQEEVHIELHDSLLSSENPDTSLETLEAWVKDTVGHDIRIYTQNLETPQVSSPVECGYFVLISIRVEAFGYCALSEEETAKIMPQAGKQILSELLASQLNPNEADFVAFSSIEHHDPSSEVLTSSPTTSGPEEYSALHNQSPAVGSTSHGTKRPCPSSGRAPKRTRLNGDGPYRGKPPSHSSTRPGEGYTQDSIGVGERYAQEFADLSTLLKTLPAIVYKLRHPSCSHSDFIASRDLAYLWSSRKCPAKPLLEFNDRIERGHFSQIFNSNMLEIEQITEAESTEYIGLFNRKLGITTPGTFSAKRGTTQIEAAKRKASRYAIWSELMGIFEEHLGEDCTVALCAIPASTSALETMKVADKTTFLNLIRERVKDPQDPILFRLRRLAMLLNGQVENDSGLEKQMEDLIAAKDEAVTSMFKYSFLKYINLEE